jgi:hypothetical protein
VTTNDDRPLVASFGTTSKQRAHELALSWAAETPPGECPLYRAHRLLDEESVEKAGFQCILTRYLGSTSSYSPTLSDDDTDFLGHLRDRICAGLQTGAYSLTGVIKRDLVDGDAKRKTFAAEWVKAVALNWEDDSASLNGEVIAVNIEVKRAATLPRPRHLNRKSSARGAAEVRQWVSAEISAKTLPRNGDKAWSQCRLHFPNFTDREAFRGWLRDLRKWRRGRPNKIASS